jgi:hypothetical protein
MYASSKENVKLAVFVFASTAGLLTIEFAEQNITRAIKTPSVGNGSTGLMLSSNMTAMNNSQSLSVPNATSPIAVGNNITNTNNITETVPAPVTKNGNKTLAGASPDCADDEVDKETIILDVNETRINAIDTSILCFFK